ncbi:hypothetical protein NPA08_04120 [Mycoplasmopsis citelli]|nr:hypothetical protein [Mycoplasmopsis citelli]UUD36109.1 hypothetical protein NPA08_04120 [Mycoplasmopsis citelli]
MINKVLLKSFYEREISIQYSLPNRDILSNCTAQYKKSGYTIIKKNKGKRSKMGDKPKKTSEELTQLERLEKENKYLRIDVRYLKKLKGLSL